MTWQLDPNQTTLLSIMLNGLIGPLIAGMVIWLLGERAIDRRTKNEAIRDLMTFRGDFASPEFRRSLNRVSVTFHKDDETRKQIRDLYDVINNPINTESNINRKIVGLIYSLCQKNGFSGITEFDIDQSFLEFKQSPLSETPVHSTATILGNNIKSKSNDKVKTRKRK